MGFGINNNRPSPSTALFARGSVSTPTGGSSGGARPTGSTNVSAGRGAELESPSGTRNPESLGRAGANDDFTPVTTGEQQTPLLNAIARGGTAPRSDSTMDRASRKLDELNRGLQAGLEGLKKVIERVKTPDARHLEDLIKVRARMVATRKAILDHTLDPFINHLRYVANHPSNIKNRPDIVAQAKNALAKATNIKNGPLNELNRHIKLMDDFISKAHKTVMGNPALKLLHGLSRVSAGLTGAFAAKEAYDISPAKDTPLLRVADGTISGLANLGLVAVGGLPAAIDNLTGRNASGALGTTVATVMALANTLLLRGDLGSINSLVDSMQQGKRGWIVQAASMVDEAVRSMGNPEEFANKTRNSSNPLLFLPSLAGENAHKLYESFKNLFGR